MQVTLNGKKYQTLQDTTGDVGTTTFHLPYVEYKEEAKRLLEEGSYLVDYLSWFDYPNKDDEDYDEENNTISVTCPSWVECNEFYDEEDEESIYDEYHEWREDESNCKVIYDNPILFQLHHMWMWGGYYPEDWEDGEWEESKKSQIPMIKEMYENYCVAIDN